MKVQRKKQLSVYLENRAGALADLCNIISDKAINLYGICAIDTIEEAVLRIVPTDAAAARAALEAKGHRIIETEVLLVELPNVPGATGKMASSLAAKGVNIDYIYASAHEGESKTVLILRTQKLAEAEEILAAS